MSNALATKTEITDRAVPVVSLNVRAKNIRNLMGEWAKNTLELGAELRAARDAFPVKDKSGKRPGWWKWLKENTEISRSQSSTFIKIADRFAGRQLPPSIGRELLRLIASHVVPEAAEREIIGRVEKGERVTSRRAIKIIKEHKFPKPSEAEKKARETGKPVQASDGNIYFGTSPEDARAGEDRRTIVYGVRRALDTLAGMATGEKPMTPAHFLQYALPHQLWSAADAHVITEARDWLDELATLWEQRS